MTFRRQCSDTTDLPNLSRLTLHTAGLNSAKRSGGPDECRDLMLDMKKSCPHLRLVGCQTYSPAVSDSVQLEGVCMLKTTKDVQKGEFLCVLTGRMKAGRTMKPEPRDYVDVAQYIQLVPAGEKNATLYQALNLPFKDNSGKERYCSMLLYYASKKIKQGVQVTSDNAIKKLTESIENNMYTLPTDVLDKIVEHDKGMLSELKENEFPEEYWLHVSALEQIPREVSLTATRDTFKPFQPPEHAESWLKITSSTRSDALGRTRASSKGGGSMSRGETLKTNELCTYIISTSRKIVVYWKGQGVMPIDPRLWEGLGNLARRVYVSVNKKTGHDALMETRVREARENERDNVYIAVAYQTNEVVGMCIARDGAPNTSCNLPQDAPVKSFEVLVIARDEAHKKGWPGDAPMSTQLWNKMLQTLRDRNESAYLLFTISGPDCVTNDDSVNFWTRAGFDRYPPTGNTERLSKTYSPRAESGAASSSSGS